MGKYVNPDNADFQTSLDAEIFVDKSLMIAELNTWVNVRDRYVCVTRPGRFGKSVTAGMLCAYYSKGCDSTSQFSPLKIAKAPSYAEHLNRHNVIFLNMRDFFSDTEKDVWAVLSRLDKTVIAELQESFPEIDLSSCVDLIDALYDIFNQSDDESFIFIIDEWDWPMRDQTRDDADMEKYLSYLTLLLKDKSYVSLAYMTGILPIKKCGTHSSLNMFREYSVLDAGVFAPYIGFTGDEVRALCAEHHSDFSAMTHWYGGYSLGKVPIIYNSNSVVETITRKVCGSYRTQIESYETLERYIDLNFDGLRDDIARLIAGEGVMVDTYTFLNDMISFHNKDDMLSLLIHLGYLSIDVEETKRKAFDDSLVVKIPNEEIREEFRCVIKVNDIIKDTNVSVHY